MKSLKNKIKHIQSMKRIIVMLFVMSAGSSVFAATYYSYAASGADLSNVNNWWTATNGTGSHPANFTGADVFEIQAGQTCSLSNNWNLTNNSAVVNIYGTFNITGAYTLTVGNSNNTNATFNIKNGGTFSNGSTGNKTFWGAVVIDAGGTWTGVAGVTNSVYLYSNFTNNNSTTLQTDNSTATYYTKNDQTYTWNSGSPGFSVYNVVSQRDGWVFKGNLYVRNNFNTTSKPGSGDATTNIYLTGTGTVLTSTGMDGPTNINFRFSPSVAGSSQTFSFGSNAGYTPAFYLENSVAVTLSGTGSMTVKTACYLAANTTLNDGGYGFILNQTSTPFTMAAGSTLNISSNSTFNQNNLWNGSSAKRTYNATSTINVSNPSVVFSYSNGNFTTNSFGNLILGSNSGASTLTFNNNTMTIQGNLSVGSNWTFGNGSNAVVVNIRGNIVNNGTLKADQNASAKFVLTGGSAVHQISGIGTIIGNSTNTALELNDAQGAEISSGAIQTISKLTQTSGIFTNKGTLTVTNAFTVPASQTFVADQNSTTTFSNNFTITGTYTANCGSLTTVTGTPANNGSLGGPTTSGSWARIVNGTAFGGTGSIAANSYIAFSGTVSCTKTGTNIAESSSQAATCFTGPTIAVSETSRTGFSYVSGSGPSSTQTYTVSGTGLTENVVITPPTNYQISTDNSTWVTNPSTISLPWGSGTLASTTIYVRLKSGLTVGSYNSESITHTSGAATQKDVSCSGSVTAVPTVVVSSGPAVSSENVGQNTTNKVVSTIALTVSDAAATVSSIVFSKTGTADYTDDITNYKLYYTGTTNSFSTGNLLGTITSGTTFSSLTQNLPVGGPYYFWITVDIKPAATVGRTLSIDAISNTSITITGASKSGSNAAGGTKTIIETTPSVTLADNTQVTAANIYINTTNNVISKFRLDVSAANSATVNTVSFTTTGDAVTTTDLTNYKLWYSTTNNFSVPAPTLLSTITTSLEAGVHSFTGLTQSITYSTTGYFWITADIPAGATTNRTLAVSAIATGDITLASGTKSGSISASGTQTISSVITLYSIASGGNWTDNTKWSTTAGGSSCSCYPQAGTHNAVITSGNPITVNAASGVVDLTINSGATLTGSSNSLTVSGNFTNSGTYSATSNTTSIAGNFTSTGTFTHNNGTVSMNGTAAQSISVSGNMNSLTIANTSATVTAGSSLTVNGTLTVNASATFDMSTYQLTVNTPTINGTIKTSCTSNPPFTTGKTWGGTVQYANTTGNVSAGTYNNLTMLNASGSPQATNNITVNGTLTTTSGGTLDLAGYTLGGTLGTITNNGTIKSTNSNPFPTGKIWGGTIEYSNIGGNQTVAQGTYNNLTLSNTSNTSTAGGNIVVNGTLTTAAGGTFSLSTNTLSGTLSSIVNNGTIATSNTSATPFPSGKTWGGTIKNLNANITLVAGTYNNFTVDNGTVTLSGAVTISGVLNWVNNGVITTTSSNTLTLTNTAVGAITNYNSSRYISGPLSRTLAVNLTSSANVYDFPVGKGGTYYPFSITTLTTGASAPVLTVEAYNANAGGTSDNTTIRSLSTSEYWSASYTGNFTTGSVSIGRASGLGSLNAIGRASSAAGTYSSLNGTVSGNNVNNSSATGNSLGYFVMGVNIMTYYSRQSGNWATNTTWSTVSCGNATNTGSYPNNGDIAIVCGGHAVTINDNISISTLTVTGAGTSLNFNSGVWDKTLTVTGDAFIDEGASVEAVNNQRYYYVFNNLKIGTNTSTSATSRFYYIPSTNNNTGVTISGMLSVGNCNNTGTALFNYSPNFTGGTNTLTIANRSIYPNGTYTFGCSGGFCPSAPTTTTTVTCPKILASSTTISGNSYVFSAGPSVAKSVTLTGSDLVGAGNIVVSTASADYEISPDNATWGSSFNIAYASGVITAQPKTLYVRLKAGKAKGSYNGATVTLVGGSASTTITLNGMVTAAISAAKSTLTPVSSNLTANGSSNLSLTVTVYDTDGNVAAIPGQTITITKQSGGGTLDAVSDNGDGTYTALLTSPTTTGSGVFVATVNGSEVQNNTGSQTQATIAYVAGEPSQLSIQAGNNQTAMPGTTVATAPSVLVTDANGNPVSGVNVTFKVTQGNGEVSDIVVVSNASGIATLGYWELGPNPGTNKVVATATSSSTSKAIRYPFPHATRQQYPYGISATNVDYVDLQDKIDTWITNYYVEGDCYGTGDCARIKWDDPNLTVSEGIAYGMLIFVYTDNETNNYKDKFDKLWTYYKKWSTSGGGLMTWRIEGFSNVNPGDTGAATDADIDAALALIQAHKQWGSTGAVNYIQEAETILAKIYDHEVENNLFKPGDGWNSVQNPSYAALFAVKKAMEIQVDEDFTQTRGWASVYTTLQNYLLHYQNDNTGLWPNWTQPDVAGTCVVSGHGSGGYSEGCWYGLDALRTPWRVAWDHAWYGTPSSKSRLNTLSDWLDASYIGGDPNNVIGKFNNLSTGTQTAYPLDAAGFVAGLAGAYMANNNATDQENLNEWYANLMARDLSNPGTLSINHPNVLADPATYGYQYYSPTLQILMGLTLSGNTPDFNTLDPVIADPVEFTATGDGLLPIQLLKFTASPQEKSVLLEWSTATESQNDYFTLYKSSKTEQFTPIATVQGAGNSNVLQSYEYLDSDVTHGMLYYQLSQTDYNGTQSFSDIVSVYFEPKNFEIISCKSDKQTTATTIEIQFLQYDEVNTLRIVNVVGQIMFEQKFTQTLYEQIELSLPPGMYTVVNSVQTLSSKQKILVK